MPASKEKIQDFLDATEFTSYQRITLPYGLEIPGKDHSQKIEAVFNSSLENKSVLDVGCYYGLYSHEAKKRGASRVVGVELNEDRFYVAKEIATLIGNGVEIVQGDIMEVELGAKFDLVIFLSVLHHVRNPIDVMHRLVDLCAETIVVEFCLPDHKLRRKGHHQKTKRYRGGLLVERLSDSYRTLLLRLIGERAGLILTGDVIEGEKEYDWTFFFNTTAFRTLFQVQNQFFTEITFIPSPQKSNRMLAICKV